MIWILGTVLGLVAEVALIVALGLRATGGDAGAAGVSAEGTGPLRVDEEDRAGRVADDPLGVAPIRAVGGGVQRRP